jgi:hypothetical protein
MRVAYVPHCKQYLLFGTDEGEIMVISKELSKMVWKQKLSASQMSLVSVAPSGKRFIALSAREKVLTWVALVHRRGKAAFELAGSAAYKTPLLPAYCVWKGDDKVALQASNGQLLQEVTAPNSLFTKFGLF